MRKNLHLVFNHARSLRMAVQEAAGNCGGTATDTLSFSGAGA